MNVSLPYEIGTVLKTIERGREEHNMVITIL